MNQLFVGMDVESRDNAVYIMPFPVAQSTVSSQHKTISAGANTAQKNCGSFNFRIK